MGLAIDPRAESSPRGLFAQLLLLQLSGCLVLVLGRPVFLYADKNTQQNQQRARGKGCHELGAEHDGLQFFFDKGSDHCFSW